MVKGLKFKENAIEEEIVQQDSERVLLEKAAYDDAGVIYPDKFEDRQEREFLYFKGLFPDTYYTWIDQVWRLLDERDGKEYIMWHMYEYVTQTIRTEGGKDIKRNHNIDTYNGFYHKPVVRVKEFNPNGTIAKASIEKLETVYTKDWSKEEFDALIDNPHNKGTTTQFALGIAPQDASSLVPLGSTTQMIKNREDFANHGYDEVMQLGRSQLSVSAPSMADIQRTLALRKQLQDNIPTPTKMPSTNVSELPKSKVTTASAK